MKLTERKTVLLLFLAALISRILIFVVFGNELIVGSDQIDYIGLGHHVAAGNPQGVLHTYWPPLFPMVLGLAEVFIDGLVFPAVVVAVLAGSVAIPLIYYFVKQSYGRPEAVIAAVLAIFYPHLINSVFAIGSENIYLLLIILCLYTGWKAVTSDSLLYYAITGGIVGLAYLSRPEAIGYPAFFIAAILVRNLWQRKEFLRRSATYCGVFLAAFLLFATPYLIYLRGETGRWTVSGKTEINTVMGDYSRVAEKVYESEVEPTISLETGRVVLYLIAGNLIEINKSIPYLVPPIVTVFVGLGLFATGWGAPRAKREIYLITFCVLTLLGYAAAVVQTRYFYILLPIILGWAAKGILAFGSWFRSSTRDVNGVVTPRIKPTYMHAICLAVLLLYLLPLNFFMRSRREAWHDRPYEERAAGIWLSENARPMAKVFSARKITPFYAEAIQVSPKTTELSQLLDEVRNSDIEYVVSGDRGNKRNPFLEDLEKELQVDPGFELVYNNDENDDYTISIYKRKQATHVSK